MHVRVQLAQIGAIVRYEVRMQWRRGVLPVVLFGFVGTLLFMNVAMKGTYKALLPAELQGNQTDQTTFELPYWLQDRGVDELTADEVRVKARTFTAMASLFAGLGLMLLMGPVMFAETIPRDRQLAVAAVAIV